MAENSKIEWCHHTFNAWEGCEKVSAGCANCYAERRDKQYHGGEHWGSNGTRKMMSESYWKQPLKWNRDAALAGERRRVFSSSLADVFEARPELVAPRIRLIALIEATPHLDWLLPTKRPQNVMPLIEQAQAGAGRAVSAHVWFARNQHVWIGASVENQEMADKRIPELLKIPAKVRFLSCEPLLGYVNLRPCWLQDGTLCDDCSSSFNGTEVDCIGAEARIHWVICGGESGPNARPMRTEWARDLLNQCVAAGVPFFFKQFGEYAHWDQIARYDYKLPGLWTKPEWFDKDKIPGVWVTPDGKTHKRTDNDDADFYYRIGKKAAGRLLDGREWNGFPQREDDV